MPAIRNSCIVVVVLVNDNVFLNVTLVALSCVESSSLDPGWLLRQLATSKSTYQRSFYALGDMRHNSLCR